MLDFELYTEELKQVLTEAIQCEYPQAKKTFKGFNFRCPVCNDSKDHWKGGRGHLLLNKTPYMYVCFNGDCEAGGGINGQTFLREFFPDYHRQYIRQIVALSKESSELKEKRKEKAKKALYTVERKLPIIAEIGKPDITNVNDFIARNKDKLADMRSIKDYPKALEFCAKRGLPEAQYKNWLYVDDDSSYIKNRIVIPFKNSKGNMYFYQARTITGEEPKYKNAISDLRPIFNYYEADFEKPVMIVEGPIDSLFLENAVALCGVKYDTRMTDSIKYKYFIFDDDGAGRKTAQEHLEKKEYVFLWKKFKHDHQISSDKKLDFNDLSIMLGVDKFNFKSLEKYFSKHLMAKALI